MAEDPQAREARRLRQAGWIRQIAAGGRARDAGLRALHEAYDANIIRLGMYRHGLSRAEAEDVWQDVLIKIVRGAEGFDPLADPAPWILRIVANHVADFKRGPWERDRAANGEDGPPDIAAPYGDPSRPGPRAADWCVQRGLRRFADSHPREAEAVELRDLDDWSIPQLAAYLERAETATRSYLTSVRAKLRPFLEECLDLIERNVERKVERKG